MEEWQREMGKRQGCAMGIAFLFIGLVFIMGAALLLEVTVIVLVRTEFTIWRYFSWMFCIIIAGIFSIRKKGDDGTDIKKGED